MTTVIISEPLPIDKKKAGSLRDLIFALSKLGEVGRGLFCPEMSSTVISLKGQGVATINLHFSFIADVNIPELEAFRANHEFKHDPEADLFVLLDYFRDTIVAHEVSDKSKLNS